MADPVDEVLPTVEAWLAAFAERIGRPAPDAATIETLLDLAGVAAHGSARQAAPIACWLVGQAGLSLDGALAAARALEV
jgi:hypothetical protein